MVSMNDMAPICRGLVGIYLPKKPTNQTREIIPGFALQLCGIPEPVDEPRRESKLFRRTSSSTGSLTRHWIVDAPDLLSTPRKLKWVRKNPPPPLCGDVSTSLRADDQKMKE